MDKRFMGKICPFCKTPLNCTQENGHLEFRAPCPADSILGLRPRLVDTTLVSFVVSCIRLRKRKGSEHHGQDSYQSVHQGTDGSPAS